MNLIFFEPDEVDDSGSIFLPRSDRRAKHIQNILFLTEGDVCKVAVLGVPDSITEATLTKIHKIENFSENNDKDNITNSVEDVQQETNGNDQKGRRRKLVPANSAIAWDLTLNITGNMPWKQHEQAAQTIETNNKPHIYLLLGCPQPKTLSRLFFTIAQLGVNHTWICNADKVEAEFFHTHLLHEQNHRPLLLKGMEQAVADTVYPIISNRFANIRCNFQRAVEATDKILYERNPNTIKIICHPYQVFPATPENSTGKQPQDQQQQKHCILTKTITAPALSDILAEKLQEYRSMHPQGPLPPVALAIGSEGGWSDEEVYMACHPESRKALPNKRKNQDEDGQVRTPAIPYTCASLGTRRIFTTEIALEAAVLFTIDTLRKFT